MIYKISGSITLMLALLVLGAWKLHTTVCMERTFNASVADVWRVWNDPDSIKKWWGPKNYTALVVRNDVREGGSYLWAMKSEQGRMFWSTGTYKEVVANKKIASTMSLAVIRGGKLARPVTERFPTTTRVSKEGCAIDWHTPYVGTPGKENAYIIR
jgi:hypothetical protein